ncbi:heavy metal-associated isoprenylated plant protein 41 [Hibiscus syriacus]|uniref:heavy metal-associated isoprenylated plant protein 41 n=1 Tax=Hibiscus syriacus TaxID=106335 RepID=UPI001921A107|nr:heavy metal-associated isoprenylated plant protein 41 [Hibiscus syriacus]
MATRESIKEFPSAENGEKDEEDEKWIAHYSSNHQILLVGEGDFSFSLSLANAFASASNICATSLDSYDVLKRKYKNAASNLENLGKLRATLLYVVNVSTMKFHTELANRKFDRIIFNFPHAGFYGKEDNLDMIKMHKQLVQRFFWSAKRMLRVNGEIHVNHKTSYPYCLWNLEGLATASFLALIQR